MLNFKAPPFCKAVKPAWNADKHRGCRVLVKVKQLVLLLQVAGKLVSTRHLSKVKQVVLLLEVTEWCFSKKVVLLN